MSFCHAFLPLITALMVVPQATPLVPSVQEGSPAPAFVLDGGRGDGADPHAPSLIVFLDLSERALPPDAGPGPSRREADAVVSVHSHLHGGGLRAVVIDVASTVRGREPRTEGIAARVRAWGLDRLPVVQDHERAGLARRYGVTDTPCVFLLDGQGIVRGRWDRLVAAAEIEARIASLGGTRGAAETPAER